jgi:aldehyde dehydrogenase (NAD+)
VEDQSLSNSSLGSLDYDPAPESASIARLRPSYGLFIDGEFSDPSTHQQFASLNPATEETLAMVSQASDADVDRAVAAARRAYDSVWSKTSGAERAKYLFRIARLIQERSRELAVVETLDNGKPIRESRDIDIPLAAAHFFYYAGWADKLDHAGFGPRPQPLGVAGQIIPWNFPLLMAAWKLAPALAAGNTCVLKPAAQRPGAGRDPPAGRTARGRRQHRHRRRHGRGGVGRSPRRQQDRLHRLDRSGPTHSTQHRVE